MGTACPINNYARRINEEVKTNIRQWIRRKTRFFPVTFLVIFNIFCFFSNYYWGITMGLDRSVSTATVYGLRNGGIGFWFPAGAKDPSFLHSVQTRPEAHPASWIMCTGGSLPGIRRPGHEADRSLSSSAAVKNSRSYTFTSSYVFMGWCLSKHVEICIKFTFY
jgi:hypothetical protein